MTRLAHISDTHIQRLKFHKEYKEVFSEIYKTLKSKKVDLIVHTGDIFHSKLELTPECTKVAYEFLSSLADIAPLHIIPGNHDVNLNNTDRLDAIYPIAKAVQAAGKDISYYRSSSVYDVPNTDIVFKVYSMLDENNWKNIILNQDENDAIVIGLYHGCLNGSKTDLGHELEGEHTLDIFKDCDYGFLGDIHKQQGFLPKKQIKEIDEEDLEEYLEKGWNILKE